MLERKVTVTVDPTPYELAFEFARMSERQQAEFFSELAVMVAKWEVPFVFQLQAIIESAALTEDGLAVMRQIGEYGEVLPNKDQDGN